MTEWPQAGPSRSALLDEDTRWVRLVSGARLFFGTVAALTAAAMLMVWVTRFQVGDNLHSFTQPNTAVSVLLLSVAALLAPRRPLAAASLAVIPFVLAVSSLLARVRGDVTLLETWLTGYHGPESGLMRSTASVWILVMATTIFAGALVVRRRTPGWLWSAVSATTAAVIVLTIGAVGVNVVNLIGVLAGREPMVDRWQTNYGFLAMLLAWVSAWVLVGQWRVMLGDSLSATALRWLVASAIVVPVVPATIISTLVQLGLLTSVLGLSLLVSTVAAAGFATGIIVFRQLRNLEQALVHRAMVDSMTGLWNLGAFRRLADRQLAHARRLHEDATVIMIDLDGLKAVNDSLGHAAGSEMIIRFSQLLTEVARAEDAVARIGGDEFAMVVRGGGDAAERVVQRLRELAVRDHADHQRPWKLAFSAGWATGHRGRGRMEDLMHAADEAMYAQKQSRPGRVANRPADI